MSTETYTGTVSELAFVRAGSSLLCQTCSDDQGDPTGDYCCECCNEREKRPGTYLTVRVDQENAALRLGRVAVIYTDATPEPQRVQPSREAVAERLYDLFTCNRVAEWGDITDDSDEPRSAWLDAADSILALLAGQPTVAHVRAEALRDAAAELDRLVELGETVFEPGTPDDDAYYSWAGMRDCIADENCRTDAQWLRVRADREAGGSNE